MFKLEDQGDARLKVLANLQMEPTRRGRVRSCQRGARLIWRVGPTIAATDETMKLEDRVRTAKTNYEKREAQRLERIERERAELEAKEREKRFAAEAERKYREFKNVEFLASKRYRVYVGDWVHAWAVRRELAAGVCWVYVGDFSWDGSSVTYCGIPTRGSTGRGKGLEYFPDWNLTIPTALISDLGKAFNVDIATEVAASGLSKRDGGSNRSW